MPKPRRSARRPPRPPAKRPAFDNGLGRFAETWSEQDLAEFEEATRCFEVVDWEHWSEGVVDRGRKRGREVKRLLAPPSRLT